MFSRYKIGCKPTIAPAIKFTLSDCPKLTTNPLINWTAEPRLNWQLHVHVRAIATITTAPSGNVCRQVDGRLSYQPTKKGFGFYRAARLLSTFPSDPFVLTTKPGVPRQLGYGFNFGVMI